MSYGDHEDAPGSSELNFRFDRPVRTADNITTYRQIIAAVGRKHGLLGSFMPKLFTGVSANGHHHHFTLVDEDGVNVFHDPDGLAQLSETAQHFLGGLLEHFHALMCVGNPTVNSYCRMWDTGFWAPIYKNWGWQNRTTTVRVASGGRFEYRGVDASCNPYLTVAAPLRAGLDGVRNKIDPGRRRPATPTTCPGRAWRSRRCPTRSARRSTQLAKDEVIKSAMPGRLYKVFEHYKRDEWERYRGGHRLGARGVPGGTPQRSCGIAGIIYRNGGGEHRVGADMTAMLQAMKHRGPDSTGYALYRPEARNYVMHVKLAESNGQPSSSSTSG